MKIPDFKLMNRHYKVAFELLNKMEAGRDYNLAQLKSLVSGVTTYSLNELVRRGHLQRSVQASKYKIYRLNPEFSFLNLEISSEKNEQILVMDNLSVKLELFHLLNPNQKLSYGQYADKFGCTKKTIYRYFRSLKMEGK